MRALASWLRAHHGVVTTSRLTALGFGKSARQALIETGVLERAFRGVYCSGLSAPTPSGRHLAAVLAYGDGAALVRWSAAFHRGGLRYAPPQIDVGVPRSGGVTQRAAVRAARLPSLSARDIQVVDGVRCTTWMRTLLDLAAVVRTARDYRWLRRCLRSAAHDEPALPARLHAFIDLHRPFRGSRILHTLLAELGPRSGMRRSELEERFLDLCADYGLPTPESNAVVHGEEVDKLFREQGFIVELDTWDHHGDPLAFERDRARDAKLAAHGWPVVRITGRRMDVERHAVGLQLRALCARPPAARDG